MWYFSWIWQIRGWNLRLTISNSNTVILVVTIPTIVVSRVVIQIATDIFLKNTYENNNDILLLLLYFFYKWNFKSCWCFVMVTLICLFDTVMPAVKLISQRAPLRPLQWEAVSLRLYKDRAMRIKSWSTTSTYWHSTPKNLAE